jgi:hypothetical protein
MSNLKQSFLIFAMCLVTFGCVTQASKPSKVYIPAQDCYNPVGSNVDPLAKVREAAKGVFLLRDVHGRSSGTGELIGCERVGNQVRYFALTAHHVLADLEERWISDDPNVIKDFRAELMFQPDFHGFPVRVSVDTVVVEHSHESLDWMIFSFVTDKIDGVGFIKLATKEEFQQVDRFEEIYGAGCGAGQGVQCRRGWMGATHNEYYGIIEQITNGFYGWDMHPQAFFRPHMNIWYGDSGGAVFNKDGKQIGVINGITALNSYGGGPVEHTAVTLKTYMIFKTVSPDTKFFKVQL